MAPYWAGMAAQDAKEKRAAYKADWQRRFEGAGSRTDDEDALEARAGPTVPSGAGVGEAASGRVVRPDKARSFAMQPSADVRQ